MPNVVLHVEGMSCGLCIARIERALREIGAFGKVDLESATVTVADDENMLKFDQMKKAIEDLGYAVKE